MIVTRDSVRAAVARALLDRPGDTEAAIMAAAQALGLDEEVVREVVEAVEGVQCAS